MDGAANPERATAAEPHAESTKPTPPAPPDAPPTESIPLEILRTLHAASLSRWENRREHEWRLNYAFWAALAGLVAVLLVAKDVRFVTPSIALIVIAGVLILLFQVGYLVPITSRAIAEIELQAVLENAMADLEPTVARIERRYLAAGMMERSPSDKHYGVIAPLGVTVVLLCVAAWLIEHPDKQSDRKDTINVICQSPTAVPATSSSTGATSHPTDTTRKARTSSDALHR